MHAHVYHELRQSTMRSVGKHDMERIIGQHAVACIDLLRTGNGRAFGANNEITKKQWSDAILYNVVGGQEDDALFEATVRKMVDRFFEICAAILIEKKAQPANKLEDQLIFYSSLSSQSRRTLVEIRKWVTNYVDSLRNLSEAKMEQDTWFMYASACMAAANRLGFFLDVELCK